MSLVLFLGLYGLHGMEFKCWFGDNFLSMMLYCVWMNVTRSVRCMNVLFDMWMSFCYGNLFPRHDVIVWILLAICNSDVLHVESVFLAWKLLLELGVVWGFRYLGTQWRLFCLCESVERGPFRLCEIVVEDWFECYTLSPVWRSGEGEDVFTLFQIVPSIVPDMRLISLSLGDQITTTLATSVLPVCSEENS